MRRVLWLECLNSPFCVQKDRIVGKDGKTEHAFVSDNFDPVFLGRFVRHETPRTGARSSGFKFETGTDCIFCVVKSATIAFVTFGLKNTTKHVL